MHTNDFVQQKLNSILTSAGSMKQKMEQLGTLEVRARQDWNTGATSTKPVHLMSADDLTS